MMASVLLGPAMTHEVVAHVQIDEDFETWGFFRPDRDQP